MSIYRHGPIFRRWCGGSAMGVQAKGTKNDCGKRHIETFFTKNKSAQGGRFGTIKVKNGHSLIGNPHFSHLYKLQITFSFLTTPPRRPPFQHSELISGVRHPLLPHMVLQIITNYHWNASLDKGFQNLNYIEYLSTCNQFNFNKFAIQKITTIIFLKIFI